MVKPAVLFDIDGTLVDSNYLHVHAWQQAFHEVGLPVQAWHVHRSIGMDGSTLVDELSNGADDDAQKRLKDSHTRHYEACADLLTALPGGARTAAAGCRPGPAGGAGDLCAGERAGHVAQNAGGATTSCPPSPRPKMSRRPSPARTSSTSRWTRPGGTGATGGVRRRHRLGRRGQCVRECRASRCCPVASAEVNSKKRPEPQPYSTTPKSCSTASTVLPSRPCSEVGFAPPSTAG